MSRLRTETGLHTNCEHLDQFFLMLPMCIVQIFFMLNCGAYTPIYSSWLPSDAAVWIVLEPRWEYLSPHYIWAWGFLLSVFLWCLAWSKFYKQKVPPPRATCTSCWFSWKLNNWTAADASRCCIQCCSNKTKGSPSTSLLFCFFPSRISLCSGPCSKNTNNSQILFPHISIYLVISINIYL